MSFITCVCPCHTGTGVMMSPCLQCQSNHQVFLPEPTINNITMESTLLLEELKKIVQLLEDIKKEVEAIEKK